MAEKEGFEPSIPFWGIHDFQSCALGQLRDFSKCAVQSAKTYYRIFMKMSSIIFTIYKKIFQLFPTLVLDFVMKIHYNIKTIGVWRSLVSRLVRVQEASGSNPDTPTKRKAHLQRWAFLLVFVGIRRGLPSHRDGKKYAGGMFFSPGENPLIAGRIQYGCGLQS